MGTKSTLEKHIRILYRENTTRQQDTCTTTTERPCSFCTDNRVLMFVPKLAYNKLVVNRTSGSLLPSCSVSPTLAFDHASTSQPPVSTRAWLHGLSKPLADGAHTSSKTAAALQYEFQLPFRHKVREFPFSPLELQPHCETPSPTLHSLLPSVRPHLTCSSSSFSSSVKGPLLNSYLGVWTENLFFILVRFFSFNLRRFDMFLSVHFFSFFKIFYVLSFYLCFCCCSFLSNS